MADLNKPMKFIALATMTTNLEYKGEVTLQSLIEDGYLDASDVNDSKEVRGALNQYSKDLGGELFTKPEGSTSDWATYDANFLEE